MDEQELQAKLMEIEIIKQQLGQMDQQKAQINARLMDAQAAAQTIADMKDTDGAIDVLVPVGGGMFTKASVSDAKKLIVHVGADIAVEKSLPEAKALMDEMKSGYEKMFNDIDKDIQNLQNHGESIYSMIEQQSRASQQPEKS
ncbi:MAG: prefoldin subunit alpha [Candidatus Aenigmarchaeota archaeon]|nr:prefoldin subunit alpha [Candidatus Aenigmarchaeota archaeon]MCK5290009.1 prefoldin subunit alpha [Candidatus Aenigmarchaeota archaeon]